MSSALWQMRFRTPVPREGTFGLKLANLHLGITLYLSCPIQWAPDWVARARPSTRPRLWPWGAPPPSRSRISCPYCRRLLLSFSFSRFFFSFVCFLFLSSLVLVAFS